ncbi:transmembrane emp24 domain-containing protein 5 isoform X1 [Nothoprocta perdicaria]|uniref:transmembrane emp24 domain-containing protein 5 isoform X1 n=1 Tax=Nothoprocta perdicaria TaxID=30464 RepID=UPI000E1BC2A4|nr:transmembrane emp24 domain-containing protein 5 isoform X1 [Nothoprocta perdicaria]
MSPKGETLVFDQRKSDGVHTVETEDGDYMFCFDNTFSTISEKVIFFELILDNMGEEGEKDQEEWKKFVTGTELLDMKLEDILESINSVKARLSKSVQIQTLLRAFEARDRNIQESNFDRVNFWSMVNLGVMVVVSAVQNLLNSTRHTRFPSHIWGFLTLTEGFAPSSSIFASTINKQLFFMLVAFVNHS